MSKSKIIRVDLEFHDYVLRLQAQLRKEKRGYVSSVEITRHLLREIKKNRTRL